MKKEDRKKRFSLKSQSCLLLKAKVLFLPLRKLYILFLLIQHFIAFLSSQNSNRGPTQCSGIFSLDDFQRPRSFHLCSQALPVCSYWFLYSLLSKDSCILETALRLCLMYLNMHSCKEKWNVFWRSWSITERIVGYFGHLSFSVSNLASWILYSLEACNLLTKTPQTLSLHYQLQNISLLFWSVNLWDSHSRIMACIKALHFFHIYG